MRKSLNKLAEARAKSGLKGVAHLLFGKMIARTWHSVVFEVSARTRIHQPIWGADDRLVIYRPGGQPIPAQVEAMIRQHERDLPDLIERGNWVYVVMRDNRCIHFGSVAFRSRHLRSLGEREGTPMIGHCFTAPGARGRGVYRSALGMMVSQLRDEGYMRVLIETFPFNVASQKGIEGAGFELLHDLRSVILFNSIVFARLDSGNKRRFRTWVI